MQQFHKLKYYSIYFITIFKKIHHVTFKGNSVLEEEEEGVTVTSRRDQSAVSMSQDTL